MTNLNITTGSIATLDLSDDTVDSGWEISGEYAIHYPCNAGYIKKRLVLPIGNSYTLTYVVDNWVSGNINIQVGNTVGASHASNGTFTETLLSTGSGQIQFYSDGFLRLKSLKYYDNGVGTQDGITLSFHEDEKHWGCEYSFGGDMFVRFINKFFSFNNGALWLHNVNPIRNNFYGVQYDSVIKFYVNVNPTTVKDFYCIRVQSNKPWGAIETGSIHILPREGKSQGQSSRLKKGNFKNYQGNFFADFLRDATDPRFNSELGALMGGALLQGQVMEITLTNSDTVEVRLLDIDVTVSSQNYTY